ncbi:MAG: hypothetical protein ACE5HR_04695 [bacterium]
MKRSDINMEKLVGDVFRDVEKARTLMVRLSRMKEGKTVQPGWKLFQTSQQRRDK